MRVFSIVFSSMFHHYTVVWYENGRGITIGSGISFGFIITAEFQP
jgi:hypothetical protein